MVEYVCHKILKWDLKKEKKIPKCMDTIWLSFHNEVNKSKVNTTVGSAGYIDSCCVPYWLRIHDGTCKNVGIIKQPVSQSVCGFCQCVRTGRKTRELVFSAIAFTFRRQSILMSLRPLPNW